MPERVRPFSGFCLGALESKVAIWVESSRPPFQAPDFAPFWLGIFNSSFFNRNKLMFFGELFPHCHFWALLFFSSHSNRQPPGNAECIFFTAAHVARTPCYIYIDETEADSAPSGACRDKPEVR